MKKKLSILRYILLISVLSGVTPLSFSFAADASSVVHIDSTMVINSEHRVDDENPKSPLYQGTYLNVDIFNPIATLFNGGRFEFVVSVDVSLWQRLFPVLEYGMTFMNRDFQLEKYKSNGLFFKVGANYNFFNFKPDRKKDHIFGAGLRYAVANVNYTLSDAKIGESYWKEEALLSNERRNVSIGWLEFVVGVRVQIYKSFFMGVNLKVKAFPHMYKSEIDYPTYVPGFGAYSSSATNFGFDYILSYQIPYKKSKKIVNK